MAKRTYGLGLVTIKMGAIAGDGGMGTSLTTLGDTVQGSATLTSADDTKTDFNIEEETDPVQSIVSQKGKKTLAWSCYNVAPTQLALFFGGTAVAYGGANRVATLGAITAGTGYTNGVYTDVPLTGGAGSGATADITVAGTVVTVVTLKYGGTGYAAGNTLSALTSNIGGTGTGFSIPVATISAAEQLGRWDAPNSSVTLEQSLEIVDQKTNKMQIVRALVTAKFNWSFTKDKLAQVDLSADVLTPAKANTPPMSVIYSS